MIELVLVLIVSAMIALLVTHTAIERQLVDLADMISRIDIEHKQTLTGETKLTLRYRFSDFETVPEDADVARQFLIVRANDMLVEPTIELSLDATSVEIEVPRDSQISVTRCWEDSSGNVSEGEAIEFFSLDTIAPPTPSSLGTPELLGEE